MPARFRKLLRPWKPLLFVPVNIVLAGDAGRLNLDLKGSPTPRVIPAGPRVCSLQGYITARRHHG